MTVKQNSRKGVNLMKVVQHKHDQRVIELNDGIQHISELPDQFRDYLSPLQEVTCCSFRSKLRDEHIKMKH
jgi:hypothetical protein